MRTILEALSRAWLLSSTIVALVGMATPSGVRADGLEGAWRLEAYQFDGNDVTVSGVMIFADGHFGMVYGMDHEGRSARGHGGRYSTDGDVITFVIPWWVEHVAGESQVMKEEQTAKGRFEQNGEALVIRFDSGSVQKFEKLPSTRDDTLSGAWDMEDYQGGAKTGPSSGIMLFADGHFALIYTMKPEGGLDGRAHGGAYRRDGESLTLDVAWDLHYVSGEPTVAERSSERTTKAIVTDDRFKLDFGEGAFMEFVRPN